MGQRCTVTSETVSITKDQEVHLEDIGKKNSVRFNDGKQQAVETAPWPLTGEEDRMGVSTDFSAHDTIDEDLFRDRSNESILHGYHEGRNCMKIAERFWMVFHCFLSFVICNMDRINLSVAILPMAQEFGWSESVKGLVQSAFFYGYTTTQIAGGRAADKKGGRLVLALGVTGWSLMTVLTPIAARTSLPFLFVVRALLGVGEGVAMPAMNAIVATWVPQEEKSRSLSFIYSGMYAGSILGLLISPFLISAFQWTWVFFVFGTVGILWVILFVLTTYSNPESSETITLRELNYILDARRKNMRAPNSRNDPAASVHDAEDLLPSESLGFEETGLGEGANTNTSYVDQPVSQSGTNERSGNQISLYEFFSYKCVWAIIIAHFCTTWGYFVLLTWLPSYLFRRFHEDMMNSSLLSIFPWVSMFIAANTGGVVADKLITKGVSVSTTRKIMQSAAFIGPSVFLLLLTQAQTPVAATVFVAIALGFAALSQSGVYSNHSDIGPECAGTLLGISNTFASLPGIIGVSVTGVILDATSGNWSAVFLLAVVFYMIGLIVYNAWATAERIW